MPYSGFLRIAVGAAISFCWLAHARAQQAPSYQYSVRYNPFEFINNAGRLAEASIQSANPGKILVSYTTGEIVPNSNPPFGREESIEISRHPLFTRVIDKAYAGNGDILILVYNTNDNIVTGMGVGVISGTELKVFTEGERLEPFDINDSGLMCGRTYYAYGHPQGTHPYGTSVPVLISRTGTVSTIPYPDPALHWGYYWNDEESYNEDNEGVAVAVNSSGTVVCTGTRHKDFADQEEFSFISSGGTTIATNLPPGATDINDNGEVVGKNGGVFWHYTPGSGTEQVYINSSFYESKAKISNDGVITITGFGGPPIIIKGGTVYSLPDLVSIPNNEFEIDLVWDMNDLGQIAVRTREVAISPFLYSTRILSPEKPKAVVNSIDDDPLSANATGSETGQFLSDGTTPECTLRSAIEAAVLGRVQNIEFDIPGGGIPVISPQTNLPEVNARIKIDGTTQDGGWVELRGNANLDHGLSLTGGSCEVSGFVIDGFSKNNAASIKISGAGDNKIHGNLIGLDSSGETTQGDFYGIVIDGSPGNVVGGDDPDERNVIFGTESCVVIKGNGADENIVTGNYIGLTQSGSQLASGITMDISGGNGNRIGGDTEQEGNIIGLQDGGVGIFAVTNAPMNGLEIVGNRIGLNLDGLTSVGGSIGMSVGGTSSDSLLGVEIRNNQVAGVHTGIWVERCPDGIIDGNTVGFAFDESGNLPAGIAPSDLFQGIRLDKCPDAEVTNNRVGGHEWDILAAGDVRYSIVAGSNGKVSVDFGVPLEASQTPYDTVLSEGLLIEGNEVGTLNKVVPPNTKQKNGISVFYHVGGAEIRDNMVVAHSNREIYVELGKDHIIEGNEVGVLNGAAAGSKYGISVLHAKNVQIGSVSNPNKVGFNELGGVLIYGDSDGAVVKGNLLGVPVGFGDPQPNANGIAIFGFEDEVPDDVLIEVNEIGGAVGRGILLSRCGATTIRENWIGVARSGHELPNRIGIEVESTPTTILRNTISANLEDGILIASHDEDSKVLIESNAIYGNGTTDDSRDGGIRYATDPIPGPPILISLQSTKPVNGKFVFFFILPNLGINETVDIEVFGNASDDEDPQGRYPLVRKPVFGGEAGIVKYEATADEISGRTFNFRTTVTIGGATSQFSTQTATLTFTPPKLKFGSVDAGSVTLFWETNPLFLPQVKFGLDEDWMDIEEPIQQSGENDFVEYPFSNNPAHFFQLRINALAVLDSIP
ncbi:MAG: hypothetical protein KDN19_14955 [Verrucomicrobiae bacterium]|nr:hypothetical protein [Verrucomicrobiae bacterium]